MKEAYYFSHDSNARNDLRVVKLRRLHGLAGVGLFWCVVEMLREADEYKLPQENIPDICFELRVEEDVFQSLFDCGLLERDEIYFWSNSLINRMKKREEISKKRAEIGRRGGYAKQKGSNSQAITKETPGIKGKESKGKESIYPQSADVVKQHLESDYGKNPSKYNILKLKDMEYVAELYFNDRSSKEWSSGECPIRRWQFDAVNYAVKCDSNGGFPRRNKTLKKQIEELPDL